MAKIKSVKTLRDIPVGGGRYVPKGEYDKGTVFNVYGILFKFTVYATKENIKDEEVFEEEIIKKNENDLFKIEYEKESIEDIKKGDKYFFIVHNYDDLDGKIRTNVDFKKWRNYGLDLERLALGNVYITFEEARQDIGVNYKKIVEEIKEELEKRNAQFLVNGIERDILNIIKKHKGKNL